MVCGWEANGGFILGSDVERQGRVLKALPTRDAVLPILGVLRAAQEKELSLTDLFSRLPKRFSRAALLKNIPRPVGRRIVEHYSPADNRVRDVVFDPHRVAFLDEEGKEISVDDVDRIEEIRNRLEALFTPALGFGKITRLNFTDGVRITFDTGDVAHFRPSGNADELRIYSVSDSLSRAEEIVRMGVAEPDGILRKLERSISPPGHQDTKA